MDPPGVSPICVFAASRDGHAARIAEHIADHLSDHLAHHPAGATLAVRYSRLSDGKIAAAEVGSAALVVLVAAVRYGRHLAEADAFLGAFRQLPSPPPIALASVCLTARKPDRRTAIDNPYLRRLIARHRLLPVLARAFPGRLDYPRYRWLDRQAIRLIMWLTGGPTDGVSRIDYTDWAEVRAFAVELAAIVETARPSPTT